MTQMHPVALGVRHGNPALGRPSVTARGVLVCNMGDGERDEGENKDVTRILNLVSRVCLSLTFTLTKNVFHCYVLTERVCLHTRTGAERTHSTAKIKRKGMS